MKYLFLLLIILGLTNIFALYVYLRKVKKLNTEKTHRSILVEKNSKSLSIVLIDRLVFIFSEYKRRVNSIIRGTKLNTALPYFFVFCLGMFINAEYIKFNNFVVVIILILFLGIVFYKKGQKKLRVEFEEGFSEALTIINSALSSGNTILFGIDRCGEKIPGVVGQEFKMMSRRLSIGEDPQQIFHDSYEHLPYREYYFFILAVLLNINGGGQVKEVMSRLSKLITDSKVMERKKYAMTAEARMSVKVLACIPVGFTFILKILSPENFEILINHPTGQLILYYAISSVLLGLFIVWNMMNKAV
ncbi:type II secretion system F family protein [Salmonella enterica subsp. enterica]|nr:type II secretion system F family protein [Salmonella enterica subsp. enterica serovar Szentes]ECN3177729.1 type II secretion system F family protein [Salmonella enterica subsp. enterica serovar Newport]EEJ3570549.1 type II secretion system F family protein [Salmonella enterica subsp. enterica]EED4984131.1 type II secretion system F family protein [Salmonella enterica subsp. enterica serovar Newport]EEI2389758.1 type II secretion system F family protein [Salmonella enterica subsp. enterica s